MLLGGRRSNPFITVQHSFFHVTTYFRCKPKNHVVQVYERFPGEGCVVFSKGIRKSNTSDKTVVTLQVKNKDEVFNFKGMGNNKKRAKCAAATCAIRELKKRHLWRIQ